MGEEGDAVGGAKEVAGGLGGLGAGKKGGGLSGGGDKEGEGKKETLRLKIELNLDVELQLKATIKGDVVIGLLN